MNAAALLLAALLAGPGPHPRGCRSPDPLRDPSLDPLLARLAHDDPDVRDRAETALEDAGSRAFGLLLRARSSHDPEVRARADAITRRHAAALHDWLEERRLWDDPLWSAARNY